MTTETVVLRRREQPETLESHWLAPVKLNNRGPFLFAVELSRARTLVTARTIESLGADFNGLAETIVISEKLEYPLLRLETIALGSLELSNFEVIVWGKPKLSREVEAELEAGMHQEGVIYHLGTHPKSAVDSILECRGILGADFLGNFKLTFDLAAAQLVVER